jgi:hypothetical protein
VVLPWRRRSDHGKEQSMSVVLVNAFEVPDGQEEKFLAD